MPIPQQYRPIIRNSVLGAGVIGVPGAFSAGLDVGAMGTLWTTMTVAIAKESGHEVDAAFASKLALATLSGVGSYLGGSKVATWAFHLIPGAGTVAAIALNTTGNAFYTYLLGCALVKMFDEEGFGLKDTAALAGQLLSIMALFPTLSSYWDMIDLLRGGTNWV
jgi:hypothetical protein